MSNNLDLKKALAELSKDALVKSDKQFNRSSPKDKHETAYTIILDAYAENIKKTLKSKHICKILVFGLAYALLAVSFFGFVVLMVILIWKRPFTEISEWCTVIVPAIISFLTVFIVIPKVITEYLFNAEEEKYMSEIIKNIQNYDKET